MKYLVILAFVALSVFPACKKTKYVDVPVHDTVVLHDTTFTPAATLVGKWWDGNDNHTKLIFDQSTYKWEENPSSYPYLVSADSIYLYGNNQLVTTVYAYKLAKTNDTLWLTYKSNTPPRTDVMFRVN